MDCVSNHTLIMKEIIPLKQISYTYMKDTIYSLRNRTPHLLCEFIFLSGS